MPVFFSALGLIAGIVLALLYPGYLPEQITTYVAVGILAAMDSVIGGFNAYKKKTFSLGIFVSGFFFNTVLAVILTFVGELLKIDLYLAAVLVFGARIFQNLAEIRRIILKYNRKDDKITI